MNKPMENPSNLRRFRVGGVLAVPQRFQLIGATEEQTVEARSMDVLVSLAEHAGEVLSRDELLEMVWGERFVGEEALTHAIWDLRRAFGDDPKTPRFIQTVRGRGYRLVAKVAWLEEGVGEQARYVIEEEIGRGAMGVVFRARDPRLERPVAVKFLPPELCRDRDSKARFLREARSAARLDHPNICAVYEVDETDDGRMYLVMPLYEGETLRERINNGPLPWPEAVRIAAEIADGLGDAHREGIVHRDLKPGNVMLPPAASAVQSDQKTSGVRILDFGLAKLRGTTQLTMAGSSLGTPSYMSPELAGRENVGPQSDLWALGVLLYEMLVGHTPFRGANAQAVIYSIVNNEPEPLPDDLEIPPPVEELIDRMLVKDPAERMGDAAAVCRRLLALTAGSSSPLEAVMTEEDEPYPGLSPFSREQARFFFGRQSEIEMVWTKLRRRSMTAIIGPSGAGKSSFVRAGVLATLPPGWRHVLFSPGSEPMVALGEAMVSELAGDPEALRQLLRFDDPDVACSAIGSWREKHPEVLVVIDQFEELFTLNSREQQRRFASILGRLTEEAGVRVLLAMRDDFFFGCHSFPELEEVFSGVVPLGAPTGDALEQALVEPALRCGYAFEDEELVHEMLGEVAGERGALPLLAFAAARLWELRDREDRLLTREAYETIGGVGGALARHAEEIMQTLGPEREPIARDLFRNLLSAEGTRAARDVEDLLSLTPDRTDMGEVLGRFVDGRLLTRFELSGDGGQRVEIIHESLLSAWPRLVRWQTQDADSAQLRDQLRRSAKLWEERQRPEDLLWTGTSYLEFRAWRNRFSGGLAASEEDFAAAMVSRASRKLRRRQFAALAVVGLLVGILIVVVGLWQRSVDQARLAEASELVARGQLELATYPSSALAHALASLELADQPAGRHLVVEALEEGPTSTYLGTEWVDDVLFTPDGRWLVAGYHDGQVVAWAQEGGEPRLLAEFERSARLRIEPGVLFAYSEAETMERRWSLPELKPLIELEVDHISHSSGGLLYATTLPESTGNSAATTGAEKLLRVWPLEGGEPRVLARVHWDQWEIKGAEVAEDREFVFVQGGEVFAMPVSSDGRGPRRKIASWSGGIQSFSLLSDGDRILTPVDHSTRLAVWSLENDSVKPLLVLNPGAEIERYRAEGETVVTSHGDGKELRVWSLSDGRPVGGSGLLQVPDRTWKAPEISSDGSWLAIPAADTVFYLYRIGAPADTRPLVLRRGPVIGTHDAAFHPDGHLLATGDIYGLAIWSLAGDSPTVIEAHETRASDVVFSPDGRSIISCTAGKDEGEFLRLDYLDGRPSRRFFEKWVVKHLFGPDGRIFAAGMQGVHLLPAADGQPGFLPGFKSHVAALALDTQGHRVAAAGGLYEADDSKVNVWDLAGDAGWPDGVRVLESGDLGWVSDLAILPDGALVSASEAGVQLWNVEAGTFEWLLERKSGYRVLGSDRNGRILATVGTDFENSVSDAIKVWDRERGATWDVTSHGDRLIALEVSPDGTKLISGAVDGVVRVGPITGETPHLLLGHHGMIWELDISADQSMVASAGDDGDLRLWPMPRGRPLQTLPYDDLLDLVRSSTNLRVVKDEASQSGYELETLPFMGWPDAQDEPAQNPSR